MKIVLPLRTSCRTALINVIFSNMCLFAVLTYNCLAFAAPPPPSSIPGSSVIVGARYGMYDSPPFGAPRDSWQIFWTYTFGDPNNNQRGVTYQITGSGIPFGMPADWPLYPNLVQQIMETANFQLISANGTTGTRYNTVWGLQLSPTRDLRVYYHGEGGQTAPPTPVQCRIVSQPQINLGTYQSTDVSGRRVDLGSRVACDAQTAITASLVSLTGGQNISFGGGVDGRLTLGARDSNTNTVVVGQGVSLDLQSAITLSAPGGGTPGNYIGVAVLNVTVH